MIKELNESTDYLISKGFDNPEIGIILGTGMGKLLEEIEIEAEVSYNHIPYFPTATVEFHKGKLIFGKLEGKKVMVMQGRFHYYEGYSLRDVTSQPNRAERQPSTRSRITLTNRPAPCWKTSSPGKTTRLWRPRRSERSKRFPAR